MPIVGGSEKGCCSAKVTDHGPICTLRFPRAPHATIGRNTNGPKGSAPFPGSTSSDSKFCNEVWMVIHGEKPPSKTILDAVGLVHINNYRKSSARNGGDAYG
jgi:hypothetical protein